MKRLVTIAAAFCLLLGCDKPVVTVKSIYLSTSSLDLQVGETASLSATVDPADASNAAYTWSSDDATVASVDESGKVKALKDGSTTIKATLTDGSKYASCRVTVTDPSVLKGISVTPSEVTLAITGTQQLDVLFTPETATNKKLTWSSSDDAVAKVSGTGLVTGVAAGSATITATSDDGGHKSTCKVTVKDTEVYSYTYFNTYCNDKQYTNPNGTILWFYSDGDNIYEGVSTGDSSKEGIYKNGSLWFKMDITSDDGALMGIVGNKLYFYKVNSFKVYDTSKNAWAFNKAVTTKPDFYFTDIAIAPDGTAYLSGTYKDDTHSSGGMVAALWTISSDLQTVTEELQHNGSTYDYYAESVALDPDGNVWTLTYRATAYGNGGLKLYKNGKYQRTVYSSPHPNGNHNHHITFKGSDMYIISSVEEAEELRVYKNSAILYKLTHPHSFYANKVYFSKTGDMYFAAHCYTDEKTFVYKNGEIIFSVDNYISSMAVVC